MSLKRCHSMPLSTCQPKRGSVFCIQKALGFPTHPLRRLACRLRVKRGSHSCSVFQTEGTERIGPKWLSLTNVSHPNAWLLGSDRFGPSAWKAEQLWLSVGAWIVVSR